MKYKVGDKVRIKSLDWYNANKNENGYVHFTKGPSMIAMMSKLCGQIVTISDVFSTDYFIKEDKNKFFWAEDILEDISEKTNNKNMKKSDLKPGMVVETREGKKYLIIEVNGKLYITRPDGYNNISDYYSEGLTQEFNDLNIDKVYKINQASRLDAILDCTDYGLTLLWERPLQVELSMQEIADKFGISVEQLKIIK